MSQYGLFRKNEYLATPKKRYERIYRKNTPEKTSKAMILALRAKGRGALNAKRSGSRRRFLRLRLRSLRCADRTSMILMGTAEEHRIKYRIRGQSSGASDVLFSKYPACGSAYLLYATAVSF
jgi:hypothetical protein